MTARKAFLLTVFVLTGSCGGTAPPAPPPPTPSDLAQPEGWKDGFALPEAEDRNPDPHLVEIHLEARPESIEVKPGLRTEVWTYDGKLPGPLIRAKKGQRLIVHFTNKLPEPTTIHWHGLRVPAAMDGHDAVQDPVPPGGTFLYEFDLPDSGTYWYHPHVRSSAQVGAGLYGALVVEDPEEPFFGDELVAVLSDIGIEADGTLTPGDSSGWFGDYFGREGNTLLVNGREMPTLLGRAGVPQRWRLINAARSRYFQLRATGQKWVRIGSDGGLIERPVDTSVITLAPGERVELVVMPFSSPGDAVMQLFDANRFHLPQPVDPKPLFTFRTVDQPAGFGAPAIPESLRGISPLDTSQANARSMEMMEKSAPGGAVLGINGKTAAESEPFHVRVGDTEVWEITNSTPYDHPFHLHGFFFQVLDVDGTAPGVREWKDTVNVQPDQRIRIAVNFDNRPGMWMFHCHILDHADLGMMAMMMLMP